MLSKTHSRILHSSIYALTLSFILSDDLLTLTFLESFCFTLKADESNHCFSFIGQSLPSLFFRPLEDLEWELLH